MLRGRKGAGSVNRLSFGSGHRAHRAYRPAARLSRGARCGLGTATVDGIYCSIAVLAGAALIPLLGAVEGPLRAVTGVVLIGLGFYGIARTRNETLNDAPGGTRVLIATYIRFIGITMVNPATLAYVAAVAFGFAGSVLADATGFIPGVRSSRRSSSARSGSHSSAERPPSRSR